MSQISKIGRKRDPSYRILTRQGLRYQKIEKERLLEKEREKLVGSIRIEAILKQKEGRKLVKSFSSGKILERILVVISFQESLNSSVWDELNSENNRYTTVNL